MALGGKIYPGIASVSCPAKRNVDVKKDGKSDGATLQDKGYDPSPVTITLRIVSEEQWDEFQTLLPDVHPRKAGGVRNVLEIVHPKANLLGIFLVYISEIEIGDPTADAGLTITLKAIETKKPVPVKNAGTGSINDAIAYLERKAFELEKTINDALAVGDTNTAKQAKAQHTEVLNKHKQLLDERAGKKKGSQGDPPKPTPPVTGDIF